MSQTELGQAIGLTFQQIQKYERGANRISASALYQLGRALDVPVAFFFDDMPQELAILERTNGGRSGTGPVIDIMTKRETLELARAYHRIRSEKLRQHLLYLIRAIARDGEGS